MVILGAILNHNPVLKSKSLAITITLCCKISLFNVVFLFSHHIVMGRYLSGYCVADFVLYILNFI